MSDAPYDQRLANEALAVDQCMKLGGVILKSQSQTTVGFSTPPAQIDAAELERQTSFNRRNS